LQILVVGSHVPIEHRVPGQTLGAHCGPTAGLHGDTASKQYGQTLIASVLTHVPAVQCRNAHESVAHRGSLSVLTTSHWLVVVLQTAFWQTASKPQSPSSQQARKSMHFEPHSRLPAGQAQFPPWQTPPAGSEQVRALFAVHVPPAPQDWQVGQDDVAQQTPSTQAPVWHWSRRLQGEPVARSATQTPPLQ